MKAHSSLLLSALLSFTSCSSARSIQLPFGLPNFEIPSAETIREKFYPFGDLHLPKFILSFTDPISSSPLLSLHRSLVNIPSVTGDEAAVAKWLAEYLVKKNYTVETQAVQPGRENVYAYIGKNRTTTVLLTSHIDAVPPFIPYKAAQVGGTIYGRGTCDAKGSIAAQIIALQEMRTAEKVQEGDVGLLFVVGEEYNGVGMVKANSLNPGWKSVIFGEPTENKLAVGHKGAIGFDIVAKGKASHSGYPELGINANSHLVSALYALDQLDLPKSDVLGNSTLNYGLMSGGVASNVISPHASSSVFIRVASDLDETIKQVKDALKGHDGVETRWLSEPLYGPVELDYDVPGFETYVASYGTDIPNLKGDHKKYLYGPGSILYAHGDNEQVTKSELHEAVKGYKELISESLWPTRGLSIVEEKESTSDTTATESVAPTDAKDRVNAILEEAKKIVEGKVTLKK